VPEPGKGKWDEPDLLSSQSAAARYGAVIRGGRVLDPETGLEAVRGRLT
jgi:hypothetical protein